MDETRSQQIVQARRNTQADWSRYLPGLGVLAVVLGVPASYLPTRTLVLCDDAPDFRHFESLNRTMWTGIVTAFLLSLVALFTLLSRQRRNWVIAVRVVFLSTVVTLVVIQGEAGAEATQVGTKIFHSQTCDEPGTYVEAPHGVLQP